MSRVARVLLLAALVVAAVACVSIGVSGAGGYAVAWKTDYVLDSLMSVDCTDLDGDGRDDLVVAGRNYMDRQFFVDILSIEANASKIRWRTPNLYEDYSSILAVAASFGGKKGILAISRTKAHWIAFDAGEFREIWQIKHDLDPGEVALADFDGDGDDEMVASKVFKKGTKYPSEALAMVEISASGVNVGGRSDDLGNIRSLAAGDVDQDGAIDLLCEVGVEGKPGEVGVFAYVNGRFVRKSSCRLAISPIYGMAVRAFPGQTAPVIVSATERGRLETFAWTGGQFVPWMPEVRFSTPLTDAAAGDLDGDGTFEIGAIGYPNMLALIRR